MAGGRRARSAAPCPVPADQQVRPTTKGANRFGSRVLPPGGGVGQKIEDGHEDEQEREED